ncbi:MAG: SDR family oxidoreductase [Beijerinckiaceae bacterium]
MRIMVLGAAGFIGRSIVAELVAHGHEVVAVVRNAGSVETALPTSQLIALDLAKAIHPDHWTPHLKGIDIVVNAAGLLRGPDLDAVHVEMPRATHTAALEAGVQRIVLISAISAREDVDTDYARSKLAGEKALESSGLGFTILRPSLVYGEGSYGGTSLMRGMAGLPFFIPLAGRGDFVFTPIHVRDLARSVRVVCEDRTFAGHTLEPVGPETMDLRALLQHYRCWLGFGQARFLSVPIAIMRIFGRVGDLAKDSPIATNSLKQMIAGNAGDSAVFEKAIGFRPRSLTQALNESPAQVQDRWHARLFFLAPALKASLIFMWLYSAWLGFTQGVEKTQEFVAAVGLSTAWVDPLRMGTGLLDLGIAALVLLDRRARVSTAVQLAVVAGYTTVLGLVLPGLWLDPLGSLIKNIPILVAIAVHGAIGDKR